MPSSEHVDMSACMVGAARRTGIRFHLSKCESARHLGCQGRVSTSFRVGGFIQPGQRYRRRQTQSTHSSGPWDPHICARGCPRLHPWAGAARYQFTASAGLTVPGAGLCRDGQAHPTPVA